MSSRKIEPDVKGTMKHEDFIIRIESYSQFAHDRVFLESKSSGKTAVIETDPRKKISNDELSSAEFKYFQSGPSPYYEITNETRGAFIRDINFLLERVRKWRGYPHKYKIKHFSQI